MFMLKANDKETANALCPNVHLEWGWFERLTFEEINSFIIMCICFV